MRRRGRGSQISVWDTGQERLGQWLIRSEAGGEPDATPTVWCDRCERKTEHARKKDPDALMCKDCGEKIFDTPTGIIRAWNSDVDWYR